MRGRTHHPTDAGNVFCHGGTCEEDVVARIAIQSLEKTQHSQLPLLEHAATKPPVSIIRSTIVYDP